MCHIRAEAKPINNNHPYFNLLFDYKTLGAINYNAGFFFSLLALREIIKSFARKLIAQTVQWPENVTLHKEFRNCQSLQLAIF